MGEFFFHLKHICLPWPKREKFISFLDFLAASELGSLSLEFSQDTQVQLAMMFSKLGTLSFLNNLTLQISTFQDFSAFDLGRKFETIDLRTYSVLGAQRFSQLPSGQGVKYLGILQIDHGRSPLTLQAIQVLKQKYPNLEVLILPYGSKVQAPTDNIGFQIYSRSRVFEEYLKEVSLLRLIF